MNPMRVLRVLVLVPLVVAVGCAGGEVPAPPAPEPGHDHAAHEHTEASTPAPDAHAHADGDGHEAHGEGAVAPMPGTYAGAVADLRAQVTEARDLAAAGKLSEIHPLTERMEETSASLPTLATGAPGADPASVAMAALALKKAAGKLHVAADGGDAAETRKVLDELDTLVAGLPAAP